MAGNINFFKGEIKLVEAVVEPRNPDEVVIISSAQYQLTRISDGEKVEEGELDIDRNTVSTILDTREAGLFELKITVRVGKETFIEKANIKVEN